MQHKDNFTFLTQAPIHKVIGTMAIPTIISMLITNLYNIADTFFVGQLDTQSTAAVGVAFSMMFAIQAFGFFFGHGSGNYISRELGARRHGNAEIMATTGFCLSFCAGVIIGALGFIFLEQLSVLLGSTPTILPYTKRYMGIILFGAPFLTSSLTLNNQMRLQGNASKAMVGIVTGAVLNVILDPILIFVCKLGVSGAALATVIGQIVSFCILIYMTHKGENIPIKLSNFHFTWWRLKEIFYGGSPSLSRQGLGALSTMMLNVAAGGYGDAAIAAMSIVNRISMFVMSVVVGLGQGFQPFCGFCYGAKLYKRLMSGFGFTVKVGTIFLIFMAILCFCFSDSIIGIFRDDPEVIAIGEIALIYQLVTWPLNEFTMAANMMLQTCRKPGRANLMAASRRGLFFIPAILILTYFYGLTGVELSQPVADVLSFLLAIPIVISFKRELDSKI